MPWNKPLGSFVFFSSSGCILPALIIANLLFGWMFFKPTEWLIISGALLLAFLINAYIFTRRVVSGVSGRDKIIDVEGEVVEEHKRLE